MRLTRTGRWTVILSVIVGVASAAAGITPLVVVSVACLAATAMAFAAVVEAPRVSTQRAARPMEVLRGSPVEVTLMFIGRSKRARSFTVIEQIDGNPFTTEMPALAAGESSSLRYPLDTTRRGIIETGPLLVRRSDLLGLVTAEASMSDRLSVAVRPRRVQIRSLPTGQLRDLEGPTREVSQGTATFHQLRDYVAGDDLRLVHWRSTARTGQLMVKQMVDTSRPQLVVVLDNRTSVATDEDFEVMVEVAHSVLHAAEQDQFPFQLLVTSSRGHDAGASSEELGYLDRLTAVGLGEVDDLTEMSSELSARGRSLVFVTGQPSAADLPLIARLARGFSPAFLVSAVVARTLPFVPPPGLTGIACSSAEEFALEWSSRS